MIQETNNLHIKILEINNEKIDAEAKVSEKERHEQSEAKLSMDYSSSHEFVNAGKSRYTNILPLEATRVKLNPDDEGADYINANYVTGEKVQEYILTQAPLPKTISDFWRMIHEQNIPLIAMLTQLQKGKADRYWPKKNTPMETTHHIIKTIETIKESGLTTRIFQLTIRATGQEREVVQLHYKEWPDSGVPNNTATLHRLFAQIDDHLRRMHAQEITGPLTIHCSAGIGRAGTLTAARIAIKRAQSAQEVNILEIVRAMRTERTGVVQGTAQYKLIYRLVREALVASSTGE